MYCRMCGKEVNDKVKFCPHCGARIRGNDKTSPREGSKLNSEKVNGLFDGSKSLIEDIKSGATDEGIVSIRQKGIKGLAENYHLTSVGVLIFALLGLTGLILPYVDVRGMFNYEATASLFQIGLDGNFPALAVGLFNILSLLEVIIVLKYYKKRKLPIWAQFALIIASIGCILINLICAVSLMNALPAFNPYDPDSTEDTEILSRTVSGGFYVMLIMQLLVLIFILLYVNMNKDGFIRSQKQQ